MALTDVRLSVLAIINEVERRLGLTTSGTLTNTSFTTMLLNFLNDVIAEISDYGDWQEMFREINVTASSSVGDYKIDVSADVKNVYEIVWDDDTPQLEVRTIEDIRRLQRVNSFGVPRQFAIVGVSATRPRFRVYPVPDSNTISNATLGGIFDIAYYKKPRLLTTSDAAVVPPFPSRLLIMGLYAKALLEENGGEPTREYAVAFSEYERQRREALNRFTHDTGSDIYITPSGSRYG